MTKGRRSYFNARKEIIKNKLPRNVPIRNTTK